MKNLLRITSLIFFIFSANNISISDDRDSILVGDRNFTVQRFTKTLFTTADQDTSWHSAYFNRQVSKFEGAKDAIEKLHNPENIKPYFL